MSDVDYDGVPVVNPAEFPHGGGYRSDCKGLFKMWAQGGTEGYVWTDSEEAYGTAFEEWVEYLDLHSPGVFEQLSEDDLKDAAKYLGYSWKPSWPDWSGNDHDFDRVVEYAEADLDVIGHTSLKSGNYIPKDSWNFQTIEAGSDEYNGVWDACAQDYYDEYGEWVDPPDCVDSKIVRGMKLDFDDDDGSLSSAPQGVFSGKNVFVLPRTGYRLEVTRYSVGTWGSLSTEEVEIVLHTLRPATSGSLIPTRGVFPLASDFDYTLEQALRRFQVPDRLNAEIRYELQQVMGAGGSAATSSRGMKLDFDDDEGSLSAAPQRVLPSWARPPRRR